MGDFGVQFGHVRFGQALSAIFPETGPRTLINALKTIDNKGF
jgi:hypothetical protein